MHSPNFIVQAIFMKTCGIFLLLLPALLFAQKQPLDHTVYDGWESIGERSISPNGSWLAYTVTPQEGDGNLVVQSTGTPVYQFEIPRGYSVNISTDSRFLVCKIKPLYSSIRAARIAKKKPDDFPKDSLAILRLGTTELVKIADVKSYKMPENGAGWLAYLEERQPQNSTRKSMAPTQKAIDSLRQTIDSLLLLVKEMKNTKSGSGDGVDAPDDPGTEKGEQGGSNLKLRNLTSGESFTIKNVQDYLFNTKGTVLLFTTTDAGERKKNGKHVLMRNLRYQNSDTLIKAASEVRNLAITDDGHQVAFVATHDVQKKGIPQYFDLYYYQSGNDSARVLVDKTTVGMQLGKTVSENGNVRFSKNGRRLFFGTHALPVAKDTSLIDIDLVKLDIWHYNDDYLQTQQLSRLNSDLKRSYLAMFRFPDNQVLQLASEGLPVVIATPEGTGRFFAAVTDTGRRVPVQWTGETLKDVYAIDVTTGNKTLIRKNFDGDVSVSPAGRYILLYDNLAKNYFVWNGSSLKNISASIKTSLANEENDVPNSPRPYGIMGWGRQDSMLYVYDRYDIWKIDPTGTKTPALLLPPGRAGKVVTRYVDLNKEERFINFSEPVAFSVFNETNKKSGYALLSPHAKTLSFLTNFDDFAYKNLSKADNSATYLFTKESYVNSPNVFYTEAPASQPVQVSNINPQQSRYNWGTAELFHWKTFDGKNATGILYKPEDFDPQKKYPMLLYFYERLSDGLHNYMAPAPTPSRLNISFFVSRGYLVFAPDVYYTTGHPGKSAYNYIVSGAQALSKKPWVDSKNIGIQGQSWGGYQVAYLITATNMFKAAWAGAPVVNMFSAYGGIRWESGSNRQMQYEKGQSRIGATLWQKPALYMENSPLFHLEKVTTPVVIMSNDADGAVPWYQGIEMFTALRRLGKKAWLLNYNGEAHNIVQRKNRKDIQIREQQFFDWLLKGSVPAKWITSGVPAVKKGIDWGLEADAAK